MAGSGIRGQFEEKFKALIRDIEEEVRYPNHFVVRSTGRFNTIKPFRQGMLFVSLMKSVSVSAVPSLRKVEHCS